MASTYLNGVFESLTHKAELKASIKKIVNDSLNRVSSLIKDKYKESSQKAKRSSLHKTIINSNRSERNASSFSPKKYLETFKEKAEENKIFAVKLFKEHKKRKYRQEKREEKIREKLEKETEEQEQSKKLLKMKQAIEKQNQIDRMMERGMERKRNLLFLKDLGAKEYRKAISATPLYKKIESDFLEKVEMPALRKRKEELEKKRLLYKPINSNELKEHARQFDEIMNKLSEQKKQNQSDYSLHRIKNLSKSKALQKVLEEERLHSFEIIQKAQRKKLLLDKKKQYSDIVKEVFQPTLDLFKKQEMELIKARLNNPVNIKFKSANDSDDEKLSPANRSFSVNQKRFKKNNMVPEKPKKKTPVIKDYIEEFRQKRRNSLSLSKMKID